jgi:hypothetical protein
MNSLPKIKDGSKNFETEKQKKLESFQSPNKMKSIPYDYFNIRISKNTIESNAKIY